jgi:hypothetical protein
MKNLLHKPKLIALAAGALLLPAIGAQAANFTFSNGDLILGFQATGGTGATQNLFYNLGAATTIRDDADGFIGTVGNLNTDLIATFGANWFSRTDLWVGAYGNLNFAPNTGIGSAPAVNGDPSRTTYVSRAATGINTSLAWSGFNSAALGNAGTNFSGLESFLPTLTATGSGAAILDQTANPTEWNNSWTQWNPTPGAAFGIWTGGIQNSFGQNATVFLDIQRVLSTNTGANPTQPTTGTGVWQTTVTIASNGDISLVPEPSSLGLLGVAAAFALLRRRSKNQQKNS